MRRRYRRWGGQEFRTRALSGHPADLSLAASTNGCPRLRLDTKQSLFQRFRTPLTKSPTWIYVSSHDSRMANVELFFVMALRICHAQSDRSLRASSSFFSVLFKSDRETRDYGVVSDRCPARFDTEGELAIGSLKRRANMQFLTEFLCSPIYPQAVFQKSRATASTFRFSMSQPANKHTDDICHSLNTVNVSYAAFCLTYGITDVAALDFRFVYDVHFHCTIQKRGTS